MLDSSSIHAIHLSVYEIEQIHAVSNLVDQQNWTIHKRIAVLGPSVAQSFQPVSHSLKINYKSLC